LARILGFQGCLSRSIISGKLFSLFIVNRNKMNFTTDLPKKDPIVSYIVASAVQCEKFFPEASKQGPVYRMHAVTLVNKLDHPHLDLNPQD
jgi:hypothetical protein